MAKPGVKELDKYIRGELSKEISKRYRSFLILSEADLQSHMCQLLTDFLKEQESKTGLHKVLNKPYLKELNIHPDLVIFRRGRPWIVIELKEGKRLKGITASREYERLIKVKEHFLQKGRSYRIRRGYLFHVSRYESYETIKKAISGRRFLYEVAVVLKDFFTDEELKQWEQEFKKWAKYVSNPAITAPNKVER